jgi:hypothetical protein
VGLTARKKFPAGETLLDIACGPSLAGKVLTGRRIVLFDTRSVTVVQEWSQAFGAWPPRIYCAHLGQEHSLHFTLYESWLADLLDRGVRRVNLHDTPWGREMRARERAR